MNSRFRFLFCAALNLATAAMVTGCFVYYALYLAIPSQEWEVARYFTNLSNAALAAAALITVPYDILSAKRGKMCLPRFLQQLRFACMTAVMVTLCTVLFFLAPLSGFRFMYAGVNLFLHLLCPLLGTLVYILGDGIPPASGKEALWGLAPMLLYAAVYLPLTVSFHIWPDFYHFNLYGLWPASFALMTGMTYALCRLLYILCRRAAKLR